MIHRLCVVLTILLCAPALRAQPVSVLRQSYGGKCEWNPTSGQFTFASSGTIDFKRDKEMSGIWTVPPEVKSILIAADTRVTGQLTLDHDCVIEGASDSASILHGTDTPELLHSKGMDAGAHCLPYSAVLGKGNIDVSVKSLTVLNPLAYMFTGMDGARIHLDHVRGIDTRGGWHNHSDGIQGAKGSTVKNCYFEAGDDVIKVYADITVDDTTIKMIQNSVPIQLGWGSYGNGAHAVFHNLVIVGERGRGKVPAVIDGTHGKYRKSIEIDGLVVKNPNSALVRLAEPEMELDLAIKNADIAVKQFAHESRGVCRSVINGSRDQQNHYTRDSK